MRNSVAVGATVSIVPRHVIGGKGYVAPSEKVNVAIIGAGGMGMRNAKSLLHEAEAQVVAVCDVADYTDLTGYWYRCHAGLYPTKQMVEEHYSEGKGSYRCGGYKDFRVMLEKEKGIDAVVCATPDHSHAYVSIVCMKQGKHVYCEKPLAHNIWEVRRMAKVARECKVATQMGNHRHSGSGIRMTCEWIRAGAIGRVVEVHAWCSEARRWKGEGRPLDTPGVPAGFDWDMWLGPREVRPYHPAYAPYLWRDWWDFGSGPLGNVATHYMDPAVWALNLESPETVEGVNTGGVSKEITACGSICTYHFAERGDQPAVKMVWYDGGLRPAYPAGIDADNPRYKFGNGGTFFVGEKGWLNCDASELSPVLWPLDLHKGYKPPAASIPRVKGHHADWLSACKGGGEASSNFDYAARLTEIAILGNVALRTGKRLKWDGAKMRATNAPEANKFIRESYRKGWEI